MTNEDIAALSLKEYDKIEEDRMEFNAWEIAKEITNRIDGAPVLGEYIRALTAEPAKNQFFFNKEELSKYTAASQGTKMSLPGAGYIRKIFAFMESHYQYGELYMEYIKESCKNDEEEVCDVCQASQWIGPTMDRIPRPYPDYSKLPELHYKCVWETPRMKNDNSERDPDDYNPRANLKRLFENEAIHLDIPEEVKDFSEKYVVSSEHVEKYLTHLQNLKWAKSIRDREREAQTKARKEKSVHEYDWPSLLEQGKLGTLTVPELEKYIKHHDLPNRGNKPDKIRCIALHLSKGNSFIGPQENVEEDDEDDSDEDVLAEIGVGTDSESSASDIEDDSDDDVLAERSAATDNEPLVNIVTRSGRQVRSRFTADEYIFF